MKKKHLSAKNHADFVNCALQELLGAGCIEEYVIKPQCINPLTVSINSSGKPRLILDLRHMNSFVEKHKVKFEGSKYALDYAKKGDSMLKFDLKSGYVHVEIHPSFNKYLGFSWKVQNDTKYFVFAVFPFGLSVAGWVFTNMLRPLVKRWRSLGFQVIVYLDDGWGSHDPQKSVVVSSYVNNDLQKAGFIINNDKSFWKPVTRLEWLGFIWDLEAGLIQIPKRKKYRFKKLDSQLDRI